MAYYPRDIGEAVIKECKRRRLSDKTAKTYLYCINKFLEFTNKPVQQTSKRDVRIFLEKLDEKGLSGNSLNTYHMAVRFLFMDILDKKMWLTIKYSKISEKMQRVLKKEEICKLLNAVSNLKHRLIISFIYSSGLRVSELVNIKIKDLALENGYGFVRLGKGRKDRIIVIADKIKSLLQDIIKGRNSEEIIFLTNRDKKYSIATIQAIVKKASKKAGLENWKEIHPHTLRHSFATHLIENGYSLNEVQTMLGHKSPETSMIYVHMASPKMINIKSPLDEL